MINFYLLPWRIGIVEHVNDYHASVTHVVATIVDSRGKKVPLKGSKELLEFIVICVNKEV